MKTTHLKYVLLAVLALTAFSAVAGHPLISPDAAMGIGMVPFMLGETASLESIATLIGQQGRAFEEYKRTNDERIAALSKGHSTADLDAKLSRIDTDLANHAAAIERAGAAMQKMQLGFGTDGKPVDPKEALHRSAFNKFIRGQDRTLTPDEAKTLTEGTDPDGGYTVPVAMGALVNTTVYETSEIRRDAGGITIGTAYYEFPTDGSEGTLGGWVSEQGTRSVTATPQLGMRRINAFEMYAQPQATQILLDDTAFDIEGWLSAKISDKYARTENDAFLNGNGVGKPRGLLTYPSGTSYGQIEQVSSGVNGEVTPDTLMNTIYAMKDAYRGGAVWGMARLLQAKVRKLKDGDGNYIWAPGLTAGQPASLLGYPVREWNDMPAAGTGTLSIAFANMKQAYLVVDRMGIRVLRDPFTAKPFVLFYSTKRTGGDVVVFEAAKLVKLS